MNKRRSVFFQIYAILLGACLAVAVLAAGLYITRIWQRFNIGYTGDFYIHSSDGQVFSTSTEASFLTKALEIEDSGRVGVGRDGDSPYVVVRHERGFALIMGSPLLGSRRLNLVGIGILILLGGITLASYLAMRAVLAPLKRLGQGVAILQSGNLSYRISTRSGDEFADLALSLNELADQVQYQLEMKEQLLLDVSHELRSPLTRIALAVEFIQDSALQDTLREDIVELESKIGQVLLSSRLDSPYGVPKPTMIETEPFLRAIIGRFGNTAPGINLYLHPDSLEFRADPELASTAFRNVLENALRYSLPDSLPVEMRASVERGCFILSVRDHGPGISDIDAERLFEPFYRADFSRDRSTGGFGIGLYLCRRILEAHGGRIFIRNAKGGGAEAILSFPYNQQLANSSLQH